MIWHRPRWPGLLGGIWPTGGILSQASGRHRRPAPRRGADRGGPFLRRSGRRPRRQRSEWSCVAMPSPAGLVGRPRPGRPAHWASRSGPGASPDPSCERALGPVGPAPDRVAAGAGRSRARHELRGAAGARAPGRVVTVHDLTALRFPEMCAPASLAYPGLVARAVRQGAFVHVPSRFVRDEVVELLRVAPERVRVVPHGLDDPGSPAPRTAAARAGASAHSGVPGPPGRCRRAPYVLALGAVEPRKDLPTLVRAFAELARDARRPRARRCRARRLGNAGICRRGRRLRRCRARRPPRLPRRRPASSPAGRCGAAGLPVFVRGLRFPAARGDGGRGARRRDAGPERSRRSWGTPPRSCRLSTPAALAAALARVIDDAGLRARLVEAGRARAASFTWASSAAAMIELYELAASDRSAR